MSDDLAGVDDGKVTAPWPTMNDANAAFHDWLRTQFADLDGAKAFVRRWYQNDQDLPELAPWQGEFGFSMRALAAHVSMALERREYDYGVFGTHTYLDTQYGPLLYGAMCDR